MATVIGAAEVRERFTEIVGRIHDSGEEVIVESSGGEPVAVMVPVDVYERFLSEREARFAVLDRFRESLPRYDENEVLGDVEEAVRAVKCERADRDY